MGTPVAPFLPFIYGLRSILDIPAAVAPILYQRPLPRIPQVRERRPFGADWYLLSGSPGLNLSACNDEEFGDARDAFTPGGAGGSSAADDMSGTVRQIDYGAVYASKSFKLQDNRTVWIGWVYEVRWKLGF